MCEAIVDIVEKGGENIVEVVKRITEITKAR